MNESFNAPSIILSEPELKARAEYWQQVLGLQDWNIQVEILRERDLRLDDAAAETCIKFIQKVAIIRLIDPLDYGEGTERFIIAQNMEKHLLHEMLHIFFSNIEDDIGEYHAKLLHQHIDVLAGIFYRIAKQHKPITILDESTKINFNYKEIEKSKDIPMPEISEALSCKLIDTPTAEANGILRQY